MSRRPLATITTLLATLTLAAQAGPLDPPAAPASSGATLDSVSTAATAAQSAASGAQTAAQAAEAAALLASDPRIPITTLPFTVTQEGSYYLRDNLTGVAGMDGITVTVPGVTIDLNGFALIGVPGALSAIDTLGVPDNLTVRNGSVRNWDEHGVYTAGGHSVLVEDLVISDIGMSGVRGGQATVVRNCAVHTTGLTDSTAPGILATNGSLVVDCVVDDALGDGIQVFSSQVRNCVVRSPNGDGIDTDGYSLVLDCTVTETGRDGIRTGSGGTVERCTAGFTSMSGIVASVEGVVRGCTVDQPFGIGINAAGDRTTIVDNVVIGRSTGVGIAATGNTGLIEGNHIQFVTTAIDTNTGFALLVMRNRTSATSGYNLTAGNAYTQEVSVGSNISGLDPMANLRY